MPRPSATKRDGVLACLRDAGDEGIDAEQFHARGFPRPGVHIESLRAEPGLAIEMGEARFVEASDGRCRSVPPRWVLVTDDWADGEQVEGATWPALFATPNGSSTR
jgi:hypothetical protein